MTLRWDMWESAWSQGRHLEASQVVWVSKKAGCIVAVAKEVGREGQMVSISRPIVGQGDYKERVERLLSCWLGSLVGGGNRGEVLCGRIL